MVIIRLLGHRKPWVRMTSWLALYGIFFLIFLGVAYATRSFFAEVWSWISQAGSEIVRVGLDG
jgi:hypothetical protein